MATIKHISSKSSDYSAAESYLIFQHDAFRNIPLLDSEGRQILREDYLIGTLECGEEDFAMACIRANCKFGTNRKPEEIKTHHYIISFDPRDKTDNGLTMEKAQELGMSFCKKHFPGHPAIVATHPDGHNGSGNIHVHIVINSLRIRDVERLPWMEKPADWQAGKKHRCTAAMLRYLRCEVMEMCTGAGLYQIDLLSGSREKVTEREYWAQKRGQRKLDNENAELVAAGLVPKQTRYETDKAILRKNIRAALRQAKTLEEFSATLLQKYGITLRESRGRFSYLPPDREKPITARKLGEDFSKESVLAVLEENAKCKFPIPKGQQNLQSDGIARLIDIEKKIAEGKGAAYQRWATVFNLKQMAKVRIFCQEHGLENEEKLAQKLTAAAQTADARLAQVKDLEAQIEVNKTISTHAANYRKYHKLSQQARQANCPQDFREEHRMELTLHDAAVRYFREHEIHTLPGPKALLAEQEALISEKAEVYRQYRDAKNEAYELRKIQSNLRDFFREVSDTQKDMSR